MNNSTLVNYKKIYYDILYKKFPEKLTICNHFFNKEKLSFLDVIQLNSIIFGLNDEKIGRSNQRHRFYDKEAILEILIYQEKYKLNNTQLSKHFKLSRNTIAKWKKLF